MGQGRKKSQTSEFRSRSPLWATESHPVGPLWGTEWTELRGREAGTQKPQSHPPGVRVALGHLLPCVSRLCLSAASCAEDSP